MLRPVDYNTLEPHLSFWLLPRQAQSSSPKKLCIPTDACITSLRELPSILCTVQVARMVEEKDSRVVIVATGRVHCLGSENKREAAWASLLQPWAGHDHDNEERRHASWACREMRSRSVLCTVWTVSEDNWLTAIRDRLRSEIEARVGQDNQQASFAGQ